MEQQSVRPQMKSAPFLNADLAQNTADRLPLERTQLSSSRTDMATARSHMANERTHLAYLRTALALMTFGITLNRFSIFLKENKTQGSISMLVQTEFVGLGMVLVGVIILIWAVRRYRRVNVQIKSGNFRPPAQAINFITFSILGLGCLTTIWLLLSRG